MTSSSTRPRRRHAASSGFQPYRAVCDLSVDEQIQTARSKIDDSLVTAAGESVSEREAMYALTTVWKHGDFARGFRWAPNHTDALEGEAPTGFQFNVSPRSPVFPACPFSRDAMFNGIMAFPLNAGHSSNKIGKQKTPVSLDYMYDSRNRVLERLCTDIDPVADLGGDADDTNFVGIFSSSGRRNAHADTEFWCVVQCNNSEISRHVYAMIEQAEPESIDDVESFSRQFIAKWNEFREHEYRIEHNIKTTTDLTGASRRDTSADVGGGGGRRNYTSWDELFFKNETMRKLQQQMELHRVGVLCKALRAVGLGLTERGESIDEIFRATLANKSLVHNVFNTVEQIDLKEELSDLVYLSNLTSIHTIGDGGVVLRESPTLGVSVLPGPWDKQGVLSHERFADNLSFIGVPTSTGMRRSNALLFAGNESIDTTPSIFAKQTLRWSVEDDIDRRHMLFDLRNNRPRGSSEWKTWERDCGFVRKPIVLQSVKVVYAKPKNVLRLPSL